MRTARDIVARWSDFMEDNTADLGNARPSSPPSDAASGNSDRTGNFRPPSTAGSTSPSASGGPDIRDSGDPPSGYRRAAGIPSEVSYTNNQPSLCFSSSGSQSAEAELVPEDDESDEDSEDEDRPAALAPYEPQDIGKWATDSRPVDIVDLNHPFFTDLPSPSAEPTSPSMDRNEEPANVPHGAWEDWQPDFVKQLGEGRLSALGAARDVY